MSKRKIYCADALLWLDKKDRKLGTIIASLPDLEEVTMSEHDYPDWFTNAARACIKHTSPKHPTIFFQTDRLFKGKRISKLSLILKAAALENVEVVWHKIVLRRDPGKIDLRRPGYSHLICLGGDGVTSGKATPDVFDAGGQLYPNGFSLAAATVALQAAKRHGLRVCDPFVGRGTVVALAETMGFEKIIGVDIDPQQCEAAKVTQLHSGGSVKKGRHLLFGEISGC